MPFDGAFAYKIGKELSLAVDCHIDKIYQPSRDELVFLLRKKGFVKRLLISAKSGGARVCFTEEKFENPAVPPMFCMLVRKHFSSAKLIAVKQKGLERIIELCFDLFVNPCVHFGNYFQILFFHRYGCYISLCPILWQRHF